MSNAKTKIYVQKNKLVKKRPTLVLEELSFKGSPEDQIQQLIKKATPHFEVDHGDGTKTIYQKKSYQQNFNKKLVKVK